MSEVNSPSEIEPLRMSEDIDEAVVQSDGEREQSSLLVVQEKIQELKDQMTETQEQLNAMHSDGDLHQYVNKELRTKAVVFQMAEEADRDCTFMEEEIRRKLEEIANVRREISIYTSLMIPNKMCKDFLWNLSPLEWREQQLSRKQRAEEIGASANDGEAATQSNTGQNDVPPIDQLSNLDNFSMKSCSQEEMSTDNKGIVGNLELSEKPQIYFTEYDQLLNIMNEEGGKNFGLLKELDDIQRALELQQMASEEAQELEDKINRLTKEAENLEKSITEKNAEAEELEKKIKSFEESENSVSHKERILMQLHQKIVEVHSACTGEKDNEHMTTCHLLGDLELHISILMDKFKSVPDEVKRPIMMQHRKEKMARIRQWEIENMEKARAKARQERDERRKERDERRKERDGKKNERSPKEVLKPTKSMRQKSSQSLKKDKPTCSDPE